MKHLASLDDLMPFLRLFGLIGGVCYATGFLGYIALAHIF